MRTWHRSPLRRFFSLLAFRLALGLLGSIDLVGSVEFLERSMNGRFALLGTEFAVPGEVGVNVTEGCTKGGDEFLDAAQDDVITASAPKFLAKGSTKSITEVLNRGHGACYPL